MEDKINILKIKIIFTFISCFLMLCSYNVFGNTSENTVEYIDKQYGQLLTVSDAINLQLHQKSKLLNDSKVSAKANTVTEERVEYLSNLNFITSNRWSYVAWGGLNKDLPPEGNKITLKVNNENKTFLKGVGMHATSQLTVDISKISQRLTRFVCKAGIDASRGANGNGVWFRVSVSNDGDNWTNLIEKSTVQKGDSEALNIDVNVRGYKYFRIYADNNGNESSDHAVLGDAKFVTEDYVPGEMAAYDRIHPLEYYDNILKAHDVEYNYQNNYKVILERELVSKLGYNTIIGLTSLELKKYRNTFDWILDNTSVLEHVIEVGELNGSKFIEVLSNLYTTYKEELKAENGQVYQKMMIALAASYSTDALIGPLSFGAKTPSYDYIERFEILKYLFDNNKFRRVNNEGMTGKMVHNDWVKDYHIALMRLLMKEPVRNDEFVWLNEYTNARGGYTFYWYDYVSPVYNKPAYQAEANREKYVTKYLLENEVLGDKYKVPYGDGAIRFWMTLENGGICWNASRGGQSMLRVNGLPAVGGYQVGHELYIAYYQTTEGKGYWNTRYGNWSGAGTTWGGGMRVRLLFNWGAKYFADETISGSKIASSTGYLYLGQENLNNLEAYRKSLYYDLGANSYDDNNKKLETYFKSLEVNDINLDTYDYIIRLYKTMSVKNEGGTITSSDWANLAKKIASAYRYNPVAMFDLFKQIRPYLEGADRIEIDGLEKDTLTKATRYASSDKAAHAEPTRVHATQLLNKVQDPPMTFSFDGVNASKLVRNPNYENAYKYSLDGGNTWVNEFKTEPTTELSSQEIASITTENDIKVKFMGLENIIYTIDITQSTLPNNLYNNDFENRIIAATDIIEWRFNETDEWTLYKTEEPDLTGNKTVEVRVSATGTKVPSNSIKYNFTEDNVIGTKKYIPIKHLSVKSVSSEETSQANQRAVHAIDGNINTIWHSSWNGSDKDRYIVIELDKEVFLSALQYYPPNSSNGRINSAKISVSVDGQTWIDLVTETNWPNNASMKEVEFEVPRRAKYVKLKANTNYGDGRSFISATMINLFEDTTSKIIPSFSFDGANAGKIVFEGETEGLSWKYSLDGGATWKSGEGISYALSAQEINSITEDNKIKLQMTSNGNQIDKTINIEKGSTPTINPYLNDLENRLIGLENISELEWKIENESNDWISYAEHEPVVEGTKTLLVRKKATGKFTASDTLSYNFTANEDPKNRKYISIKHLTIESYSTQSQDSSRPFYAPNAIDGNLNTMWHTTFTEDLAISGKKATLVIKLDEPKYISALEFIQRKYREADPAFIKTVRVYVSTDGKEWIQAGIGENFEQEENVFRNIEFNESVLGQYVKFEAETYEMFASASMINLYEDETAKNFATFSFSGQDAGKIILTDEFSGRRWRYSIDGGTTWKETSTDIYQLTSDELERINENDDLKITFDGEDRVYTLNIIKSSTPNNSAYLSDIENRLLDMTDIENLEWKIEREVEGSETPISTEWKSYVDEEPVVRGDAKLIIRAKARGLYLASDTIEYQFTDNNEPETRRYVSIKHLSISEFSSQSTSPENRVFLAQNVIDAKPNTQWHTDFGASYGESAFVTIKLDKSRYISGFDYQHIELQDGNNNTMYGFINEATVLVSEDGKKWEQAGKFENIHKDSDLKQFTFDEPVYGQYVKVVMKSDDNVFVSASTINIYEDVTKISHTTPTAQIEYSTKELTNQNVTVTLVNPSTDITVINNGGRKTYTFESNGSFKFEFEDENGNKGETIANVNWIDKIAPTATLEYSTKQNTTDPVTVTLKPSEEVTVTNNNGSKTYTFTKSGSFKFEFVDRAGNTGEATATVDWIKEPTKIEVSYSIKELTNQNVIATIESKNSNITVTNNNGSKSYTFETNGRFNFEYEDEYGIAGSMTVMVDWIDKVAPTAEVSYSTTAHTLNPVIVTLTPSENITILDKDLEYTKNDDGTYDIVYKNNGTYTINFVDDAGNPGEATATIDCIREKTKATLSYSTKELTNKDVVVTITANNDITIDNNNGSNEYTFTENGEFTFEYTGEFGVKGTATAKVDWIDKVAPTATFEYNITETTVNPVRATLNPSEEVTILNNDGKNTKVFTENNSFEFIFVDKAGNTGKATATVSWINKVPGIDLVYSTTDKTNEDVEVTLVTADDVNINITNNNGSNKYVFTENKSFTFEYVDEDNVSKTITAQVDWIDKVAPTAEITYNKKTLTNKDVLVTIKFSEKVSILNEDIEYIKNDDGTYTIIFKQNTECELEFEDEAGNKSKESINIDWIDKDAPIAEFEYSTKDITLDPVTVTLKTNEKVKILNNNGSDTYTFTENGSFKFEFEDEAGNRSEATASVNWIRKTLKVNLIYSPKDKTNGNVTVTLVTENKDDYINITNNNGSNTYTFTENGKFTFEYVGGYGIPNSITAEVDWIDKNAPTAEVTYNTTDSSNKQATVTVKFNEKIEVLADGQVKCIDEENNIYEIVFLRNGNHTIRFMDEAGNVGTEIIEINTIDETIPTVEVTYNTTEPTNQEVIATLKFNEKVEILTGGLEIEDKGNNTFELTIDKNGVYEIEFVDEVGNKGTKIFAVNNIDKDVPTAEITYNTTEPTNKEVIATLKFNEEVEILTEGLEIENKGNNTYELKVTKNEKYTVEFIDKAGNKGTTTVEVNNIDKNVPTVEVKYNTNEITNQEVIATLKFDKEVEITTKDVEIEKIDGNTYNVKFKDNDEIVIEYKDQAGNVGSTTLKVDWIQRLPNINVSYDITTETKGNVTVTITADDVIRIKNNGGKNTYTFTENGEFVFEYIDKYGNEGKVTTKVDWIVKEIEKPVEPVVPINPSENKPSEGHNQVVVNGSITNNQVGDMPDNISETNANENENNNLIEGEYNYSNGDILVKVSSKQDIKNATLINKKLIMDKEFRNIVGKVSEYFELYLENGNKDRIDLESSNVSIRFKLDSSKVFTGIYKVNADNTLEKVEYEVIDDDYIMVNTENLGKYILSYDEKQEEQVEQEQVESQPDNKIDTSNNVEKSSETNKFIVIGIIVGVILVLLFTVVIIKKNKKNNTLF